MEMVRGANGANVDRQMEGLQRPACCAHSDPLGDVFDPVSCLLRFFSRSAKVAQQTKQC
jgi:hypothetical protein